MQQAVDVGCLDRLFHPVFRSPGTYHRLLADVCDRSRDRRSRSPGRRRHSLGSPPRDKRARSRSNDSGRGAKRKRSPETSKASKGREKEVEKKSSKDAGSSRGKDAQQLPGKHRENEVKDSDKADHALQDAFTNGEKAGHEGKDAEKVVEELPLPPPPPRPKADGEAPVEVKVDPLSASSSQSNQEKDAVTPADATKKQDKPKKEKKEKDSKKHKKEKKEKKEKKSKGNKADKAKSTGEKSDSPSVEEAVDPKELQDWELQSERPFWVIWVSDKCFLTFMQVALSCLSWQAERQKPYFIGWGHFRS